MKAILLSAGQGRRLLPLTRTQPKCLLPVQGHTRILDLQLESLARCGMRRVTVMVGFGAAQVERRVVHACAPGFSVSTLFNPFYATADNLITAWVARSEMDEDFVLLNGDTLFDPRLLEQLLESSHSPVTIAVDHKDSYDDDDMKVVVDSCGRLRAIGKKLEGRAPDGEAIGMSLFRGSGVVSFREALERAVRSPDANAAWYTSVLEALAREEQVDTVSIDGLWWTEIDCSDDLEAARAQLRPRARSLPAATIAKL